MRGYLLSGLVGMVTVEPGRHHGSDAEERNDAIRARMAIRSHCRRGNTRTW
jgi:hypothetical protein